MNFLKKSPLLLFSVLLACLFVLLLKPKAFSPRAFAITNPKVDKICLYKNNLPAGKLIRTYNGNWITGNGLAVDPSLKGLMLDALSKITLTSPVPSSQTRLVRNQLKKEGFVIEYYQDNYLLKAIFFSKIKGSDTHCYAMKEGEDIPYVVYIPKATKTVVDLFSSTELYWAERSLLGSKYEDIASFKVEYFDNKEDSFEAVKEGGSFRLVDSIATKSQGDRLKRYIEALAKIKASTYISNNELLQDSLEQSKPFCKIIVKNKDSINGNLITLYSIEGANELLYMRKDLQKEIYFVRSEKEKPLLLRRKDFI